MKIKKAAVFFDNYKEKNIQTMIMMIDPFTTGKNNNLYFTSQSHTEHCENDKPKGDGTEGQTLR